MSPKSNDVPIHAHSKDELYQNTRSITRKNGMYEIAEVCRISVNHNYDSKCKIKEADDLCIELSNVICEYLESRRPVETNEP